MMVKNHNHMVSAWSSHNGLVLGQQKTAEKSNEITAIPELLNVLEIKGCIVTIDAMGCQQDIAKQITKRKADYILALNGNQKTLYREVREFFETAEEYHFQDVEHDYHKSYDGGHGRVETRECWAIKPVKGCFSTAHKWSNLQSFIMVKSKREMPDKVTEDTRFYISSLIPDAKKSLESVRKHWGVENSLHWVLDVTFREDESRIRMDEAPENFAVIRHIALNLIKSDTSLKASVKRKRLRAAIKDDYREVLIRQCI